MKRLDVISFSVFLILVLCSCSPKSRSEKENTRVAVNQFVEAISKNDFQKFSDVVAHEDGVVGIGTDSKDWWDGWAGLSGSMETLFKQQVKTSFSIRNQMITIGEHGDTAWFSQNLDATLWDDQGQSVEFRGIRSTGVLVKKGKKWQVVQFHTSVPADKQTP